MNCDLVARTRVATTAGGQPPARRAGYRDVPVTRARGDLAEWPALSRTARPTAADQPVELAAIVIFRIADGKIAERWAGWKPGRAPVR